MMQSFDGLSSRYSGETAARTARALQHLQSLLPNATLADVQRWVGQLQHIYGSGQPLETLIQEFVSRDLERQLEERRQRRQVGHKGVTV